MYLFIPDLPRGPCGADFSNEKSGFISDCISLGPFLVNALELFGNQHVYALNRKDRIVRKIILPMFNVEASWKKDVNGRVILSAMLKRKSPVMADVMKAYSVLYGKEPLEMG